MDEDGIVDMELRRDGKKVLLKDYRIVPVAYDDGNGGTVMKYGVYFDVEDGNFINTVRYSWYNCLDFVRMVRMGLSQLIHGQAAVSDMTGVVGIVDIINETGQSAPTMSQGLENVMYLVAFIAVNLSVMNMLPIPALDGGHIMFCFYEMLTGRKPSDRFMAVAQMIGMLLLLLLMMLAFGNDIGRLLR